METYKIEITIDNLDFATYTGIMSTLKNMIENSKHEINVRADVTGQSEQLTAFAEYCDKEHGLFIPSWMIDGYNKSR